MDIEYVENLDIEEHQEWEQAVAAFEISLYHRDINVAIHSQPPDKKIADKRKEAIKELERKKQLLLFGDDVNNELSQRSHTAVKRMAMAGKIKKK